jgi:hypothetical protein
MTRCRVCDRNERAKVIEVRASRVGEARVWNVMTCRDCWRAFEAMLDAGTSQPFLARVHDGLRDRPWWFL